ncbi:MAG: amidohydrolase family protein [Planctomycetota bacterium]
MLFDAHVHIFGRGSWEEDALIAAASRAGVDRIVVSCLGLRTYLANPGLGETEAANRCVRGFVRRHAGFAWGLAYVNPRHGRKGLDALKRDLDAPRIVGVKLWVSCLASDRRVFPVVEEAIARGVPVVQHAWLKTDGSQLAGESTPRDVAELARLYPEATVLMPHLAGNQARGLYEIADFPNVHLDTSGSDPEAGVIEEACRRVGAGRVVFGSDAPGRSFASQIAKVVGSRIGARAKAGILGGNLERLLRGLL